MDNGVDCPRRYSGGDNLRFVFKVGGYGKDRKVNEDSDHSVADLILSKNERLYI